MTSSIGEYNFDFHNDMSMIVVTLLAVSIIVVTPIIDINSAFANIQQHGLNNNDNSHYIQCMKLLNKVQSRNIIVKVRSPIPNSRE